MDKLLEYFKFQSNTKRQSQIISRKSNELLSKFEILDYYLMFDETEDNNELYLPIIYASLYKGKVNNSMLFKEQSAF